MNNFMTSLNEVSAMLLPVLGVVALIFLISLLWELNKVVKSLDGAVIKAHSTIDLTNKSIEKVQAPLDTAARLSESVDKAHAAGVKAVGEAKDYLNRNASVIREGAEKAKEKVSEALKKKEKEMGTKEPGPEDIIGG